MTIVQIPTVVVILSISILTHFNPAQCSQISDKRTLSKEIIGETRESEIFDEMYNKAKKFIEDYIAKDEKMYTDQAGNLISGSVINKQISEIISESIKPLSTFIYNNMVEYYVTEFTKSELEDTVKFLKSSAGKKFMDSGDGIARIVRPRLMNESNEVVFRLTAKVAELRSRYTLRE